MSAEREYASKGVAGTGLGLGIGGAATGVPALIMSIIALIREGNQQKAAAACTAAGVTMAEVIAIMNSQNCGKTNCWESTPATHYDLNQAEIISGKDMEIAYLRGQNATNDKLANLADRVSARFEKMQDRMDVQFAAVNGELREQAVYNATNTAGINCLKGQVAQLQAEFNSLTEIGVPASHIIHKRGCNGGGTDINIDVIVEAVAKAMGK